MPELTWRGKYDDAGRRVAPLRVTLPFQAVETVNESAQERQRSLDFFSNDRVADWRNRLIWGDKKYVLPALIPELSGKVDLVYIDPPFGTGQNFTLPIEVSGEDFDKEPSMIEVKAYRDTWGRGLDSYLEWTYEMSLNLRELVSTTASLYIHLDTGLSHYIKSVLDEVFGAENYRNEIAWKRTSGHSDARGYGRSHDVLLFYAMSAESTWNEPMQPYDESYVDQYYRYTDDDGRKFMSADLGAAGLKGGGYDYEWRGVRRVWRCPVETMERYEAEGRIFYTRNGIPRLKRFLDEARGLPAQDVWSDVESLRSWHTERMGYPTQKPESLLQRIIEASSNEGDLVLDCVCGSGTTAVVAEKLRRRWIACDVGRFAIHTTRKRLLGIGDIRPFIVENLGKYERQLWQEAEFGESASARTAAYRSFILDLYHATPVNGYAWLHGLKNGRMVHVGTVDAPVTVGDVRQIVTEFRKAVGTGKSAPKEQSVDILGWDFAFELNEIARQDAEKAGIDLHLKSFV